MSSNRRNFLRNITLGTSAIVSGLPAWAVGNEIDGEANNKRLGNQQPGHFNMSGFAAPKLDKVRIGFVGLGMRGPGAVERMSFIEGVEIKALCDKFPERVTSAQKILEKAGLPKAKEYTGENGWKAMAESNDLDLIYITTPWSLHTPIAVYAMEHGKHAASEVPAALTIDQCWQLVETSEKTRKHCMMLENCCYDFFELLTLNMARNGVFGELVHTEGAYLHNLVNLNFDKKGYADMWRLKENAKRNGNLYPTHGLGPIAQVLNINRGDQMDHLVSMSSNDFTMQAHAKELAAKDDFFKPFTTAHFRGNMNNTIIRTMKGKTMLLQHDVSSTRPYSRIHLVSGTKGIAQKWPEPARIALGEEWASAEEMKSLEEKYTLPIVKHIGNIAKSVGGHGGMDFIMDWRLIDCLRNGLPLDQNVYDAALWSSIAPLSEASVKNRSRSMDVPDFTRGNWKTNKPVDLTLDGGGTTTIRNSSATNNK
ncbi:Gfo/Idh/MocA family protein [Flavihumibacter profundi]|uniref:Gfo/Idh/MocA family protein n=1 Tax=Flavihumibacter profundi TaxID=2716883 RepID=UPI001CC541F7|nr:Gfo/Idh/MocA family oxidoreductase [Flavihumibacter profundi]MBZ5856751.1 Gfo/Idh/MocA family oxidoreductase [Flavihumibacter profundi]